MSVVNSTFVTISCDAVNCGKTVTFAQTQADEAAAIEANPWLSTVRFIQTLDKRALSYCSDQCEVLATGQGLHNKLEPKKIVTVGNQAQVDLAAQAATRAAQATAALKQGSGVQLS